MTDRHPDRQTEKQNGMTIRLTLCERDAIIQYLYTALKSYKGYRGGGGFRL